MNSTQTLRAVLTRNLDRPGLRWLLSALYPLAARGDPHGVRKLQFDRGWVHHFDDGILVEAKPRRCADELSEQRNAEYCGHLYRPREGDTILDIGAGYGWEAIYFARHVGPTGRVIAVEAHPLLGSMLARSVELNRLANIVPLNLALADRAQKLFIENDLKHHLGNAVSEQRAGDGMIEVDAVTVDELSERFALERIDFLKMNIEGAEQLAIKGMTKSIRMTAVVAISCHDFKFGRTENPFFQTKATVQQWLQDNGLVIVPRQSALPWLADQVNAYNPKLMGKDQLNPAAFSAG